MKKLITNNQLNSHLYNKILGALVGFAIGDSMGATTEFMSYSEIMARYGFVENLIGGGWLNLKPGDVTDDTEMMMIVAKARMSGEEGFLDRCCKGFVEWLGTNPRDVGNTCRKAIMDGGDNPPKEWMRLSLERQAFYLKEDLGNGAVMRCLFLALIGETPLAIEQGRLTHNNKVSDLGIENYCHMVFRALHFDYIMPEDSLKGPMKPSGMVSDSVHNAIYWSSKAKTFKEAIVSPVNHGGDADTIAALTGGLAGARFGFKEIPREWVERLNRKVFRELRRMAIWIVKELTK